VQLTLFLIDNPCVSDPGSSVSLFPRYHQSNMASTKFLLQEFPWHERYRVSDPERVLTPALALYPDVIASNIRCTLDLLAGRACVKPKKKRKEKRRGEKKRTVKSR